MSRKLALRHRARERAAALCAVAALLFLAAPSAVAQNYVPITGSGSTWSSNALDQWRRNVYSLYGITVQFDGAGSSKGRADFKAQQVNFGVSEIEYGLTDGGIKDQEPGFPYAYMPIVAGGTSFMYNLKIGNRRVTNLRLSGEVIAKIFTRQITSWADPAIKADNPGLTLPGRQIVPVVRSDGSGTTAQFTRWLAAKHGGIWDAFCGRANCGFTSVYPQNKPGIQSRGQSTGVANFVQQASGEGAITYVEYSYAKNAGFPVAKVLNEKGYYIEPTAKSVAVALLDADIRADLTQELARVYGKGTATDARSYPLSSYSYMILPTAENTRTKAAQGRTLSDFAYYFLCEGQQQAEALGYSPLPVNLVKAGVKQVARIPGTTNKLRENDLGRCNNPTLSPSGGNRLAETAPFPPDCDKKGPVQCTTGTAGATGDTPSSNGNQNNNGGGGAGPGTGGGDAAANTGQAPAGAAVDPDTGQPVGGDGTGLASNAAAIPVQVDLPDNGERQLLTAFAIALLAALVLGPPLVSRFLNGRRSRS